MWIRDQVLCALLRHDPRSGLTETVIDEIDGERLCKPNNLAFDAAGNLVFTCPKESRTEPAGYVCCLAADGSATRIAEGFYFPNGLALTANGSRLILAETYRGRLWEARWNAAARSWTDRRVVAGVGGPIGPDGMAFAEDGRLFVAVFDQGVVRIVGPAGEIPVPGRRPTIVAFGPTGRLGLVVTEAAQGRLPSFTQITSRSLRFPRSAP